MPVNVEKQQTVIDTSSREFRLTGTSSPLASLGVSVTDEIHLKKYSAKARGDTRP